MQVKFPHFCRVAFFADLAECIFSTIQVDKLQNRDDSD
jgi:hypothetical protein